MVKKYCIIGNGIAGDAAATVIRENDLESNIIMVTEEGTPMYNRILLKEFAKGKVKEKTTKIRDEDWYLNKNIDLRLNTRVIRIDSGEKIIEMETGETQEYDQLLIATGGTPREMNAPGSDLEGIHHFWTINDTQRIRKHAETADDGVVIGGGLLGIDLAAICAAHGIRGKYIMRGDIWWRNALSKVGGEIINKSLEDRNVMPLFNREIECFNGSGGKVKSVVTNDGEVHETDFVGVAVGLDYNTEILQGTDIKCNNGILVDEYMSTDTDGIYAAGDVAEYQDVILEEKNQNGDWGSAKKQGAIAGWNMVNGDNFKKFEWVPSYSITHFEYPIVSFGHPSKGEEYIERKYEENEWRRLAFRQGRLIGGVLIGNVSPQSIYKKLILSKNKRIIQESSLLNERFNLKDIEERI